MTSPPLHAVTGAFGYSGRYIARRLLAKGYRVRTLTNSSDPTHELERQIETRPLAFEGRQDIVNALRGVSVLHNTYWVRFNCNQFACNQSVAVENSIRLFRAAREAGVRKVVHVSITNPSRDSRFEYFRDKAVLEDALKETFTSYCILRPTVLFGKEDILINNIAWLLRSYPVFPVPGNGRYRLQPIYVDDLAKLAVEESQNEESTIIDAIGPETFDYRDLVRTIGEIIGKRRLIVSVPSSLVLTAGNLIGKMVGDVLITREEIEGLMQELLYVDSPPAGETRLTDWAKANRDSLGIRYASELARRRRASRGDS